METLLKSTSSCTPYLINYPNDEGYSIMLADGENIRPLMISDIGALDPQVLQNAINGNTPSNTPTPTPIEPAPIDEDEGLEPEDAPHGDEHIEPFPMDILPFDYNPPITGAQPNPGYNENIPPMIDEIVEAGAKAGVEKDEKLLTPVLPSMKLQLKALLARDLWDMNEMYQILNEDNDSLRKALEVLRDGTYSRLLE